MQYLQHFAGGLLAEFLLFLIAHPALGLLSAFLVLAWSAAQAKPPKWAVLFSLLGLCSLLPLLGMMMLPSVEAGMLGAVWAPSLYDEAAYALAFALGIGGMFYWHRVWAPRLNAIAANLTKATRLERNRRTDVRQIAQFLPAAIGGYDPAKFIKPKRGLFLGLDEKKKPVYADYEESRIQHVLLTGRTRSGKGVAAQIIIPQQIARGEYRGGSVRLNTIPGLDQWIGCVSKSMLQRLSTAAGGRRMRRTADRRGGQPVDHAATSGRDSESK
ncbi:hypothetical protein [Thiomonas bhubaneswarensis]|uniref:Uncharacterized protein n=1 Tax=Thiomonas bhubaneswarensis TaxID=339866 RepID=A0A0K6ID00_9BURK|nr:hypothetical protein [Thiomonas bhubaneswarensis]CUB00928.1 hypothetical protein Ga0061069_1198 [Thiomonas bhubaneswarensis]